MLSIDDKVSTMVILYDHDKGSVPYTCELTGKITSFSEDSDGKPIAKIEGYVLSRLGNVSSWCWCPLDEIIQPVAGNQLRLI